MSDFHEFIKLENNADYYPRGLRSVVIRNLIRSAKQGDFKSLDDIHSTIQHMKNDLNDTEKDLIKLFEMHNACKHENYLPATYTLRKMAVCWVYVYERKCSVCDYVEDYRCKEEDNNLGKPEWTINAAQRYYNNDIF